MVKTGISNADREGSAPSLGSWTVHAPSGRIGTLSIDTAGKRVLVTVDKTPLGTSVFFR